ncbi:putative toxin-antitoxin system toxin component, PIN family [Stenotrophomonas sp. MMGLT7]|uniref:putative toxin-antitoxin system toxin component, PIN family n=1 Tax=Stenotrophomonas sp. MMGLT7 TaxID=2901227 RepID=UPI001E65C368|nr:putative toxin-antitoxin system toxin component, PIN family [Stenotrophomonas sp. MMGLT7]MCD7098538.1 putative toxin-antitoxin system toxin component, PIN family [Stenotrophomonas sp. MMGLT7]
MRIERVVIDTNVLISAALSARSAPARIVDCLLQHATLVFSRPTFDELETRLWRPKFDRYLDIERRQRLLHDLAAIAEWVTLPDPAGAAYSRDPDDDVFIHTALHGKAQWLVSGDRDLLELPLGPGLEILSPAQALERWRQD